MSSAVNKEYIGYFSCNSTLYQVINHSLPSAHGGTNDNSAWEIDTAYGLYKFLYANFKK